MNCDYGNNMADIALYPKTHRHCLWSVTTGVLGSIGSTHPVVQRLLFLPLSAAVKSTLRPPVGSATTPFLSTPQSSTLCGHSNLRPKLPLSSNIYYLMTLLSPRGNTEPVCLWRAPCADADVSLHCSFSLCSHPSTLGLGSNDQLTKQLSEESFSPADWGLPTVVSFLSYRPEIIQSTGFELQIREEEDDLRDGPTVYGAEVKE